MSDPAIRQVVDASYQEILRANYALLLRMDEKLEGTQNLPPSQIASTLNLASVDKLVGTTILDTQTNSKRSAIPVVGMAPL